MLPVQTVNACEPPQHQRATLRDRHFRDEISPILPGKEP